MSTTKADVTAAAISDLAKAVHAVRFAMAAEAQEINDRAHDGDGRPTQAEHTYPAGMPAIHELTAWISTWSLYNPPAPTPDTYTPDPSKSATKAWIDSAHAERSARLAMEAAAWQHNTKPTAQTLADLDNAAAEYGRATARAHMASLGR